MSELLPKVDLEMVVLLFAPPCPVSFASHTPLLVLFIVFSLLSRLDLDFPSREDLQLLPFEQVGPLKHLFPLGFHVSRLCYLLPEPCQCFRTDIRQLVPTELHLAIVLVSREKDSQFFLFLAVVVTYFDDAYPAFLDQLLHIVDYLEIAKLQFLIVLDTECALVEHESF